MLVIRDAQIQTFIAGNDDDLLKIVCEAVIKANQTRVSSIRPGRLISMVKLGIKQAKQLGAVKPEDIGVFVGLMFEIAPSFYSQPMIAAVLADENFVIGDRLSQLPERVPTEAWIEAQNSYDEKFWFRSDA